LGSGLARLTAVKETYHLRKLGLELGNSITESVKFRLLPWGKRWGKLDIYYENSIRTKTEIFARKIPPPSFLQ
jgi:hypothetical protein